MSQHGHNASGIPPPVAVKLYGQPSAELQQALREQQRIKLVDAGHVVAVFSGDAPKHLVESELTHGIDVVVHNPSAAAQETVREVTGIDRKPISSCLLVTNKGPSRRSTRHRLLSDAIFFARGHNAGQVASAEVANEIVLLIVKRSHRPSVTNNSGMIPPAELIQFYRREQDYYYHYELPGQTNTSITPRVERYVYDNGKDGNTIAFLFNLNSSAGTWTDYIRELYMGVDLRYGNSNSPIPVVATPQHATDGVMQLSIKRDMAFYYEGDDTPQPWTLDHGESLTGVPEHYKSRTNPAPSYSNYPGSANGILYYMPEFHAYDALSAKSGFLYEIPFGAEFCTYVFVYCWDNSGWGVWGYSYEHTTYF